MFYGTQLALLADLTLHQKHYHKRMVHLYSVAEFLQSMVITNKSIIHSNTGFCGYTFLCLLSKQLEIRLEGYRVSICIIFERLYKHFFFQSRNKISGTFQQYMRI